MPSTRFERLLALAGLVVVFALTILTAVAWVDYAEAEPESAARTVSSETAAAPTTAADEPAATAPIVRTRDDVRTPTAGVSVQSGPMHLELTAARGECWLQVRRGSSAGELVYAGTLAQGDSRSFSAKRLWIELGAPHTLDAVLDGKPVTNLPRNTATVIATRDGIELAESAATAE